MRETSLNFNLPEGSKSINVIEYSQDDRGILREVYDDWINLSNKLETLRSRRVNLPEGLSEGAFCLEMGCYRQLGNIPGANSSFDCIWPNGKRIQVKSASVIPDLTSFGPRSVWDELYFCDFYREGLRDGSFDIYLIPNETIYSFPVRQGETLLDQQRQGRRPRLRVFPDIIQRDNIQPVRTGQL